MKKAHTADHAVRLDKWLWAARFFKTRSLAADDIAKGRVNVNGHAAKASRELRAGDVVSFRQGRIEREVRVLGLSAVRGPAAVAQTLYADTPESLARQALAAEQHRLAPEPALSHELGRPTKADRRQRADWERWSASLDK